MDWYIQLVRSRLSLCALALVACNPAAPPDVVRLSLMTWNLQGPTLEGERLDAMREIVAAAHPSVVAIQECGECDQRDGLLPPGYQLTAEARSGVALAYRGLELLSKGTLLLTEDDDGWGERVAMWGVFREPHSGAHLAAYSTHWCMPLRRGDDRCDQARHLDYARAVVDHARGVEAPAVVAGDLNLFGGFGDSPVLDYLRFNPLHRLVVVEPPDDGATFRGSDFAPPGRIDFVLLGTGVRPGQATVGDGPSDHRFVLANFAVELGD